MSAPQRHAHVPERLRAEGVVRVCTGGMLVVTADHTEWGMAGVSTIAPRSRADAIVTDEGSGHGARLALDSEICEVVLGGLSGEVIDGRTSRSAAAVGA